MKDAAGKLAKMDAMPMSQRDMLIDCAGDLAELCPEGLEFVADVVTAANEQGEPFDPIRVYTVALKVFNARRRSN